MKLVAIDTSSPYTVVVLLDNYRVVAESAERRPLRYASVLVPVLEQLFHTANWQSTDVTGWIVGLGPGSFTGLRVGITTVKTLAWAGQAPVVGIDSFRVIAANALDQRDRTIVVALDARRQQVYTAQYRVQDGEPFELSAPALQPIEQWLENLPAEAFVIGDVIGVLGDEISQLDRGIELAEETLWHPRGAWLAKFGAQRLHEGEHVDPMRLEPLYLHAKDCMVTTQKGRL